MSKGVAFRIIILTGWIIGMLAPVYAFSRVSPPSFRTAFDRVFQTQVSHVLMHGLLYAVLAYILASLFFRSASSAKHLIILLLMMVAVVAALQETIQMISGGITFGGDEIFDFFVDLSGGVIGIWLHFRFRRASTKSITDGAT